MTERGTSGSTSNPPAGANVTAGAMTVDVEDYFQVAALSQQIRREDWDSHPCRVERNVDRILGLFSESGVSATFFTLGWIAERYPPVEIGRASCRESVCQHGGVTVVP